MKIISFYSHINMLNNENFIFVSRSYTIMATYSHIIRPTNAPQLWPIEGTELIKLSVMRGVIGRPKKNSNKANDKPKNTNTFPQNL